MVVGFWLSPVLMPADVGLRAGVALLAMSLLIRPTAGSRVVVVRAAGVPRGGSSWVVELVCVSDAAGWVAEVVTDDLPFAQVGCSVN